MPMIGMACEQREAAIAELAPHVDALAAALDKMKAAGVAMAAAASEVCARTPYGNASFSTNLADLFVGIGINVDQVLASARNISMRSRVAMRSRRGSRRRSWCRGRPR
jgi:hypothetical protein